MVRIISTAVVKNILAFSKSTLTMKKVDFQSEMKSSRCRVWKKGDIRKAQTPKIIWNTKFPVLTMQSESSSLYYNLPLESIARI